jgi:hypothetical protein
MPLKRPAGEETGCPVRLEVLPGSLFCLLLPSREEHELILSAGRENGFNFACNFIYSAKFRFGFISNFKDMSAGGVTV